MLLHLSIFVRCQLESRPRTGQSLDFEPASPISTNGLQIPSHVVPFDGLDLVTPFSVVLRVGLDLRLRGVDPERVWGKSDHLPGQLVAPEPAPAKLHTVQVSFHEQLPADVQSFGLVKLRARVPWRDDGRHLLSFHRQMPTGWPEPPHDEADESALSGRTAAVTGPAHLYFGLPFLTADRTKVLKVGVNALEIVLAWMREAAQGGRVVRQFETNPTPESERSCGP